MPSQRCRRTLGGFYPLLLYVVVGQPQLTPPIKLYTAIVIRGGQTPLGKATVHEHPFNLADLNIDSKLKLDFPSGAVGLQASLDSWYFGWAKRPRQGSTLFLHPNEHFAANFQIVIGSLGIELGLIFIGNFATGPRWTPAPSCPATSTLSRDQI